MSGNTPDPVLDAAGRLLDTVEGELFTTAQDLAAREPSLPTLGTVVTALLERVGQRARSERADEEFIATLTYTVWSAAEGMATRARAATAVPD